MAGKSVSSAGDINGDGINDVIVGAPIASRTGRSYAGICYVIYGKSGGLVDLDLANITLSEGFKISGAEGAGFGQAGRSVSSAGDINGDGINDVIIGASEASPSGRTNAGTSYVIYGKAGGVADLYLLTLTPAQGFKILGAVSYGWAGSAVSSSGDINGDGVNDVIIGAPNASPSGRTNAGMSYVIYGKRGGLVDVDLFSLTPAQGFKILGAARYDCVGASVSSAGDINSDGINDVMVGAPVTYRSGRSYAGAAYVIYGKLGGLADVDLLSLTAAQGFKILGATSGDSAGSSVSSAGDINGDGKSDIIVGASGVGSSAGAAYVIYGKTGGVADVDLLNLTSAQGFKILGAASNDHSGNSVSSAGDINGDGLNDVIIGAPAINTNRTGTAYVIYGKIGGHADVDLLGLTAEQGFRILGAASNDWAGGSVSSAGDINGDGINDVIIGADQASPSGRTNAGTSYIIYGMNASATTSPTEQPTLAPTTSMPTTSTPTTVGPTTSGPTTLPTTYVPTTSAPTTSRHTTAMPTASSPTRQPTLAPTVAPSMNPTPLPFDSFKRIIGTDGPDNITTTDGNNLVEGKGSADILDGGPGYNAVSYETSPETVTITLATGRGSRGDAEGDRVRNFQGILGSPFGDVLIGDDSSNTIYGMGGNDIIEGRGGNDLFIGGPGSDIFKIDSMSTNVTIQDFEINSDKLDFLAFSNIHRLKDITQTRSQNDTILSSNGWQVLLQNVVPPLDDNQFVFNTGTTKESWWTTAKISTILGGVAVTLGIAYALHACKKDGVFCFKKAGWIEDASQALLNTEIESSIEMVGVRNHQVDEAM